MMTARPDGEPHPDRLRPTRRGVLSGGSALIGNALLTGCRLGGRGAGKGLRVAVIGKGATDTRLLFPAAGIKPDFPISYAEFESGHLAVEALNSGAIDLAGMSEIPPVFALASSVQSFVQIAVEHGDVNSQVILVPRGSPIRTLADLKGKRVGYVRATTSQYYLIRMLQSVGLSWADIFPVAMTVADGAAAFAHGALDAWAVYGYPIERAIANDGARILKTALGFLSGNYLLAAHKDAVADGQRADWIGRFLRLQRQAFGWAASHETQWAPAVAQAIGVPAEYVRAQFARKSDPYQLRPVTDAAIASQQLVADVFAAAALIPHKVDVRPLWDARFNSVIEEA
jgi:sulfonate transport system substrate-binding protein